MRELLELVDNLRAEGPTASDLAQLDTYIAAAEGRRSDLARRLDMADEFIALLRERRP